ncbi:GATOR complex protein WDR59 isoform X2 [Anthonomus grandis grandis]|uniref:GATOR complex protein WDR59 isoform X2 n=1 Tax=Anthonomus grandis grandis TaxID=2921223 RepID=UPI002166AD5E|nr:GATOR complex protein WDR59 isoform X2 [Anthonomus grandis grandis]
MARVINNDYYIALECKDLQANAMSVDCTGTYALLAGRRCIALRNLDEEYENILKFPRTSKYEVGAAEWNPTSHHKDICAISTNERLEILNWREETLSVSHSLRAHTRSISGLNWHKTDPNILATSSVDTFVNIWDIRDAKKPTLSLSNVAESSQVRWNKVSQNLLATAHDGDIKIWDQRKGNYPLQYISAHLAKIYGLDWSPHIENQIASASQDNTVKFFDTSNPRKPEFVLSTGSPVWRARYTPFGNGLVTVVVPQLRRGHENSLLLWNIANRTAPMHTFVGHRDVVLEFQWRPSRSNDPNFQLVTWSRDQTLLVWKIEPFLQKLCGYEPDDISFYDDNSSIGLIDEVASTVSSRKTSKIQPLQQEFSLLNVQIPNLEVKSMEPISRCVTVMARISSFIVNMQITFPNSYPHGVPPVFQIVHGSNINESSRSQLLQTLNHLAQQRVSKNRTCLEPCLRQMVATLEQLACDIDLDRNFDRVYTESALTVGGYNDSYIPFPRTSGAKFCSVNTLVCFGRPLLTRRLGSKNDAGTPRALSALEALLAKRSTDQMTVSAYYFQKQKQRSRSKHTLSKASKAMVHVYDATCLFLINRQLAEEYILDGDVDTVCKHNAAAAAVVGRKDLVQAWTIAELTLSHRQSDDDGVWTAHPCGDNLLTALIKHYASQSDLQMAAMLCCIFGKHQANLLRKKAQLLPAIGGSPYHTIPSADIVAEGWVLPILKSTRSTSLDNLKIDEIVISPLPPIVPSKVPYVALYEYFKLAYAETLHRWRLLYNRAEVMKFMAIQPEPYKGAEFIPDCQTCQTPIKKAVCTNCKKLPLHCIVCNMAVKASVNCCLLCGHGGHTDHLEQWFRKKSVCALCGCHCLFETTSTIGS